MKIWQHRISREGECSYPLLEKGFLATGWSNIGHRDILDKIRSIDNNNVELRKIETDNYKGGGVDIFCLRRFAQIAKGDLIVVPRRYQEFGIYEALGEAIPVSEMTLPADFKNESGKSVVLKDGFLQTDDDSYDLGFVIPVKALADRIPRWDYADADLTARMKAQRTTYDISDLEDCVNRSLKAFQKKEPLNLYSELAEPAQKLVLDKIRLVLNPDKLEYFIKDFLPKLGASSVNIPSKNESGKQGDADVIAVFETLKLIVYIQAKFHAGDTNEWAVQQIKEYCEYREDHRDSMEKDGYTRAAWVISTADRFSEAAISLAAKEGVRLIDGPSFAQMLLDVGFAGRSI